ncbi:C4-dicarboxylic acid transporter DauA [Fundidesulfovibrio magnetotacticus]|uniref:C4-dicarboxylic acid transporter DauA n=1 Tax=Fundidesulfovibrio magnetotacticus TaxID=2730080 RepID=A0A6V8LR17_9BACT|nr:SulP family inorganic anion transporter [Fundidesulfovibrio magnetotacticus]GFK92569.1 C4-dicarboxylic acid transporter DauA [Fundidesulfovibrio magnetotacticus]
MEEASFAGREATGWPVPKLFRVLRRGLGLRDLTKDVLAGLTVGVVALPLAMAFAIASHVPPERGIFTAIVAGFLISFLGGSRFAVGGPTGAFVVIIAGVVDRHGYDGLVLTTLLAGAMLLLMGAARLGKLIKFIPYPVTTGFTSGIAVLIFFSQLTEFFGMKLAHVPSEFLPKVALLASSLDKVDPATSAIGLVSLGAILLARRFFPIIPAPVFGVAVGAVTAAAFFLPVETIGTRFGGIPSALPAFTPPTLDWSSVKGLMPDAMTIALLAGIESLLCCVVADGMTGDRHDSSAELMAQGTANIASVLFGGIPATGAIARTVTSIKSGAVSPVAGCVHALTLVLFVLFAAPLASAIPLASLAAVLLVVAFDMSEYRRFARLLKAPRSDVSVLLATFSLTVLVDLTVAVYVGVLLASLLFMRRMSELTEISTWKLPGNDKEEDEAPMSLAGRSDGPGDYESCPLPSGNVAGDDSIQVYEIDGPFFFGIADRFQDILDVVKGKPRVFILDVTHTPTIDSTGVNALEGFIRKCRHRKIELFLVGARPHFLTTMHRFGTDDLIGPDHLYNSVIEAIQAAEKVPYRI